MGVYKTLAILKEEGFRTLRTTKGHKLARSRDPVVEQNKRALRKILRSDNPKFDEAAFGRARKRIERHNDNNLGEWYDIKEGRRRNFGNRYARNRNRKKGGLIEEDIGAWD